VKVLASFLSDGVCIFTGGGCMFLIGGVNGWMRTNLLSVYRSADDVRKKRRVIVSRLHKMLQCG
jgi:hypothetical protein